jgi:serine/threonine protein kinase
VSERTRKLEEIFHVASELNTPEQRQRYLEEACRGDVDLRGEVEALLNAAAEGQDMFGPCEQAGAQSAALVEEAGSVIGGYKLLQKIGEGGMGVVYMAEQEQPVRRKVALKIIKLGMDTRQVIARFEAERQALAMMDSPHIARVLDGGATGTGRPYFVMEIVEGVPITQFCGTNQLSIEERLKLFIPVCHAIQSAHQKGIIHRDIKPSNVLVTMHNGVLHPMVIDFGVAKAVDQKLTEKTLFTTFGTVIGTPAYMSPEQAEMSKLDVDTRSDIYSLGVLLYELLTGTTPFPEERLRSVAYVEMQRIIAEEEPERPSTRLRKRLTSKSQIANIANRKLQIDPDLDWIVMKCLEKDRERRYDTASGLAMDLKRYLKNEAVLARPPSAVYRCRKFVRRHKLQVTAVSGIGIALVAGIVVSSWQAVRARRAEQQQAVERARAEKRLRATMRFFDRAFNSVSPALADVIGAALPREQLASAAADALDELQQGEEPDAASRVVLGQLYLQLAASHGWFTGNTTGDYEKADKAITEAIRLFESAGNTSADYQLVRKLAGAEMVAGLIAVGLLKPQEAIEHHQKSYQWATRLGEQTTNSYFLAQSTMRKGWATGNIGEALVRLDRCEEAITNIFLPELDRLRKRGLTNASPDIELWDLKTLNDNLAMAYYRLGRHAEALPYLREALHFIEMITKRQPHHAQFSSSLALVRAGTGEVLLRLQQVEEGLQLLRDAAEQADNLAKRDPASAGFAQVQIEVAWRSAAGCAAWANHSSATSAERRARLAQAQTHIDRAHTLLAGLKSESLRKFLRHEMSRAETELKEAGAKGLAAEVQ